MELATQHLYELLKTRQNLPENEAAKYVQQVTKSLHYLHHLTPPIIHRDLKPENLLVFKNAEGKIDIKLADFGWSNMKDKSRETYCGTPDYLSPEMIKGVSHDEGIDIWAIGILMFELLVGSAPFTPGVGGNPGGEAKSQMEKMKVLEANIMRGEVHFPITVSIEAQNLIKKLLRPDPHSRPRTGEILSDIFFSKNGLGQTEPSVSTFTPYSQKKESNFPFQAVTTSSQQIQNNFSFKNPLEHKLLGGQVKILPSS
jgi:aurora kinase, other